VYWYTQHYFIPTSRQVKRLDSVSKSPVFAHFSETLVGVSSIRAFSVQWRFLAENREKLETNLRAYFMYVSANRWLAMRLEFIGTGITALAALFATVQRGTIDPGLGGLSISYALGITQTLNWMVRMTAEFENAIVAVERCKDYADTDPEAPTVIETNRPAASWPMEGRIVFNNVKMSYRPGLPLVLNGFTADIAPKEKIGIVGRTGAGKSSLLLALMRIVELYDGSIVIDGIDISKIGLHDLRSHISIIPQDPVLFTGTIRMNLDPFKNSTDEQIWEALRRSHLFKHIQQLDGDLDCVVEEGGRNFSVGQRQLLCLTRALLRSSRILLLDEATSAVDQETDQLVQTTIREEFKNYTMITIAHRIETIMDSDRVFVLDSGTLQENGAPATLLKNPKSHFRKLWEASQKSA